MIECPVCGAIHFLRFNDDNLCADCRYWSEILSDLYFVNLGLQPSLQNPESVVNTGSEGIFEKSRSEGFSGVSCSPICIEISSSGVVPSCELCADCPYRYQPLSDVYTGGVSRA